MPLTPLTILMIDREPQLRALLLAYMKKDHSDEQFYFYYSKEDNQVKFNKYIKSGAPKEVNLSAKLKNQLRTLAAQGRWVEMTTLMGRAKTEVVRGMSDILYAFSATPEYSRWHVLKYKKLTDKGAKAFNLLKKDLGMGKKEADLKALMLIVEGGRTPADRKAAFLKVNKMMKLTVKAATHFKTAGLAVP